ncbi:MAG: hypothetical protein K2X59_12100 [Sphingomonas sp.]|nr:hypothetical protein [Sphingomonas sp.]
MEKPAPADRAARDEVEPAPSWPTRDWGDDWVHELIEMTRPGAEINLSFRGLGDRIIPFQFNDFS